MYTINLLAIAAHYIFEMLLLKKGVIGLLQIALIMLQFLILLHSGINILIGQSEILGRVLIRVDVLLQSLETLLLNITLIELPAPRKNP